MDLLCASLHQKSLIRDLNNYTPEKERPQLAFDRIVNAASYKRPHARTHKDKDTHRVAIVLIFRSLISGLFCTLSHKLQGHDSESQTPPQNCNEVRTQSGP